MIAAAAKPSRNNRGSTPESSSDEWRTPLKLFRAIERHLGLIFIADMAATKDNALCPIYFTEEDNTLLLPSDDILSRLHRSHTTVDPDRHALFCNPPYKNTGLTAWMEKGKLVSERLGLPWVNLLPASRTEQEFMHMYAADKFHLDFLKKRADYLREDGTPGGRPNHPSFLVTFPGSNKRILGGTFGLMEWRDE